MLTVPSRGKDADGKTPVIGSPVSSDSVDQPSHFRRIGKLLELCADGCRRIQLNRPPHGPFGFYIGPSQHRSGILSDYALMASV